MDVGSDRGRVDNENNNQSRYSNISNIVQGEVYIYESENIAIRNKNISEYGWNTGSDVYRKGNKECYVGTLEQEQEQEKEQNWNGLK